MTQLDPAVCERARLSRDARFDGRFFIGVVTTGVYCRPICPVRPPKAVNVRFFPSAAAASEAGFRPCLRCRPECSPGTPAWLGTSASVSRGLRLIAAGALDEGSVGELAATLGLSARHLSRLFIRHLGASPAAVAQTRRLHFAKRLINDTQLPMAQVAFASGFGSVRRFNDTIRTVYRRTPSDLRSAARRRGTRTLGTDGAAFTMRLPYRPPYDWAALMRFIAPRATPGVEVAADAGYRRTILLDGHAGVLHVRPAPKGHCLLLSIEYPEPGGLFRIVERVRRMFDLGADPTEISDLLGADAHLAPLVRANPGLRVPGAWDGFELAVRAILGQQVTVKGATTLAGRLVATFGTPLPAAYASDGLTALFPTPPAVAEADLSTIGLPRARADAIRALGAAVCAGRVSFDGGSELETTVRQLAELPGIGDWTAHYIAMRACNEPDAFPASDLGLLRAAGNGVPMTPVALRRQAEAWRPWRAYAAIHLWHGYAAAGNDGARAVAR